MFENRIEVKLYGADDDHAFFASVPRVGDYVALLDSTAEQRVEKVLFKVIGTQESEIHVYLEEKKALAARTPSKVAKARRSTGV